MNESFLNRLDHAAAELRSVAQGTTARWTAAAGIGVATLLIGIDWIGRFHDPGLRWLFSAALIATTLVAARGAWRRFRPRGATRLGVAQRIQELRPDLGSRLASAVEFAEGETHDPTAGSTELRRAVVLGVANDSDQLPFDAVVDRTAMRRATRWLIASVAALSAFAVVNAPALATGLIRLAAPWAHAPWPRETALEAVDPPTLLARGAPFEAVVINRTGPIPDDTRIEYRLARDASRESAATQLVGDQAIASRTSVQRSFAYRFVGGDDDTMAWIDLQVVDPPLAEQLSVSVDPPSYSGLPAARSSSAIRVLAGSRLTARGIASKPITSATVVLPNEQTVPLTPGEERRFSGPTRGWVAAAPTEGDYQLRLTGESGVTGVVGPHRYEVLADEPPKPEWQSDTDDKMVPAGAVLPIEGVASDDLALQRIELRWRPAGDDAAEPQRIVLSDRGATTPETALGRRDQQRIEYEWDLASLGLQPGAELLLDLVATDYRGAEGHTSAPRRVGIVTQDEFLQRIAQQQSRLLGQVQQGLVAQRAAASATADLDAETRPANPIDRRSLDRLTSIEFQQREAAAIVEDPTTGAAASAKRLLKELRRSRVEAPDLDSQLATAAKSLESVAREQMPSARSELADARRAGQRSQQGDTEASGDFSKRLTDARAEQATAVERLEEVAELLTSWADYQRFAAEAASLEQMQRELAAEAQRQATAAASKVELDPTEADREKLITRQAEATRRFDKLRQAMQRLLQNQLGGAPPTQATESVGDALAEADDNDVGGKLRDAAREVARGRLGSASRSQEEAADGLRAMLEALRQRTTNDPEELVKRLEGEKQKLAELQQEVQRLRQQPDTRQTRSARERVASRASRQGRRLERLTASQAAASAQQGAEQAGGQQRDGPQPEQLAEAQESFQQAQQQIDQRIRELQNQQTQRLLDQLASRIGGYIERQGSVLDDVLGLANQPLDRVEPAVRRLARDERDLSDELGGFAEKLSKRAVFELALRGAADAAADGAQRLDEARVDKRTQRLLNDTLARLEQIQEVLRQNQQDREQQQGQQQGGQGAQPGQPPPPSPIDVAELKMLRLMQLGLIGDTDKYEADTATARRRGRALPEEWVRFGRELAARQRELTELALELSERDNDPEAENRAE